MVLPTIDTNAEVVLVGVFVVFLLEPDANVLVLDAAVVVLVVLSLSFTIKKALKHLFTTKTFFRKLA